MAATPSSTPKPPAPLQDPDQNSDHREPSTPSSPTPTASNPNSPKPVQSVSPPPKKTQPLPWTHPETVNLIQAYQEKWYSLKRGQLKANQWEEIAITVAARCGYDEPTKTAIQCRHKIEKLRKRFRAQKQKPNPRAWEYFDLMDCMQRGPLPISAHPMTLIQYQNSNPSDDLNEDNDDDEEEEEEQEQEVNEVKYDDTSKRNKSKSINHIVLGHVNTNKPAMDPKLRGGSDRVSDILQRPMLRKRNERYKSEDGDEEEEGEDDDDEEEEEEEEEEEMMVGEGREMVLELAAEIKAFAESLLRMENKKMEMMRETQRYRMEMENKRMEMILDSRRKIVDTIGRAFGSHKKLKMAQDI